jgi:Pilus assembly protein, PilO
LEPSVSAIATPATRALRVMLARSHQRLGTHGLLGCALLLLALAVLSLGWRKHQSALNAAAQLPEVAVVAASTGPALSPPAERLLPDASELPRLLSRIERAATAAGLGWPRADYRVSTATDDTPASVEVRCTLKGPYPAMRRFVTALLQDTPTLTLKEFALSRAGADVADLEAKLAIVVYLGSDSAPSSGSRR